MTETRIDRTMGERLQVKFAWPVAGIMLFAAIAIAQQPATTGWGDLSGRVAWPNNKKMPDVRKAEVPKWFTPAAPVTAETYVIHPKNLGVKNVVVWLEPAKKGDPPLPVFPALKPPPKAAAEIDISAGAFVPHVLGMREGQSLRVKNSSANLHSVRYSAHPLINPRPTLWPVLLEPGAKGHEFAGLKAQRLPILFDCNLHAWLKGYVFVFDHPYFAVTDENGDFAIKNAPAGDYRIMYWHDTGWLGGIKGKDGSSVGIAAGRNNNLGLILFP